MGDSQRDATRSPTRMACSTQILFSALCLIFIAAAVSSSPEDQIVPEADFSIIKDFEEAHDSLVLIQDEDMASWTYCAKEHHRCKFSGKASVKYGAKGKYAYKTKTGGVHCSNSVFGDPKRGTAKKCYYQKIAKKVAKKKKVVAKRGCKCLGREMAVDASTAAFVAAMTSSAQTTTGTELSEEAKTAHDAELTEVLLKGTKCEQWSGSTGKKWCTVSSSCAAATGVVNNVKIKGKCVPFCHSAGFKVPAKMKCATSDHVVAIRQEKASKKRIEKATKVAAEKAKKKLEKDRKKAAEKKAKAEKAAKKAAELKKKKEAERAKKAAKKAAEKKAKAVAAEQKVKADKRERAAKAAAKKELKEKQRVAELAAKAAAAKAAAKKKELNAKALEKAGKEAAHKKKAAAAAAEKKKKVKAKEAEAAAKAAKAEKKVKKDKADKAAEAKVKADKKAADEKKKKAEEVANKHAYRDSCCKNQSFDDNWCSIVCKKDKSTGQCAGSKSQPNVCGTYCKGTCPNFCGEKKCPATSSSCKNVSFKDDWCSIVCKKDKSTGLCAGSKSQPNVCGTYCKGTCPNFCPRKCVKKPECKNVSFGHDWCSIVCKKDKSTGQCAGSKSQPNVCGTYCKGTCPNFCVPKDCPA